MGAKLRNAFNTIHDKGYVHNDISPNSIIVHNHNFGIASKENEKIKGFRATPHFNGQDCFQEIPSGIEWTSKSEFDFCSLAFSIPWLAGPFINENNIWDSFQPFKVNGELKEKDLDKWAESRYDTAERNFESLKGDVDSWIAVVQDDAQDERARVE